MILNTPDKSISVVLGESAGTECDVVVAWADITNSTFVDGSNSTTTNDTTPVTIIGAPAASTRRRVKQISIFNGDSIEHEVTVQFIDVAAPLTSTLWKGSIEAGQLLLYSGETWNNGILGTVGAPGGDGDDGTIWRSGSGAPSDAVGVDGDFYFRTDTSDVYKRASGTYSVVANLQGADGAAGADGADGVDGATWRSGSGAPSDAVGVDGDFYFRTDTSDVYKRASGTYSIIANLQGALSPSVTATFTVGYTFTPFDAGTKSSGTFTPDPANGNYQYYTNNGAHILAAPSSDCAIDILVTNGASAGAITFSGMTVSANTGDALTTTNTHKFIISLRRINSVATYIIKALQ